ncbi:MAG: hypothetical protein Q4F74_07800, partial [Synergistaceae bacterium]|nr:hypothetical protein [Synergistaceae bacterium]
MKSSLRCSRILRTLAAAALIALFAAPSVCCAAGKVVRVGFFAFPGYHMMDKNGHKSGYGYDYISSIANWTDWKCEFTGYERSWND